MSHRQSKAGLPTGTTTAKKAPASPTVEHVGRRLWHGQVQRALDLIADTVAALDAVATEASSAGATAGKVVKLLRGLETCVDGQSE